MVLELEIQGSTTSWIVPSKSGLWCCCQEGQGAIEDLVGVPLSYGTFEGQFCLSGRPWLDQLSSIEKKYTFVVCAQIFMLVYLMLPENP